MVLGSSPVADESPLTEFINNADIDKKIATLATKAELKAAQDKITKLQVFDSSYFRGKDHFKNNGTQNYLIFQPMYRYF